MMRFGRNVFKIVMMIGALDWWMSTTAVVALGVAVGDG